MQAVLIVERDPELLDTLKMVLEDGGYPTQATGDLVLARAALTVAKQPLVVLVGHSGQSELANQLLVQMNGLRPHAYIVVSTWPCRAPVAWNTHTARTVPVISAPFDVDDLLQQVEAAAAALAACAQTTLASTGSPSRSRSEVAVQAR